MPISKDAFTPCRGLEENILNLDKAPYTDGRVYFAYDTNKIFFDAQGERRTMSGEGIIFVYGADQNPIQSTEVLTDYTLKKEFVNNNKPVSLDNIIINIDGGFYKVIGINEDTYTCVLMAIAGGSGGGTGGSGRRIQIRTEENFPLVAAKGYPIEGKFTATSSFGEENATVLITIESPERLEPIEFQQDIMTGQQYTITISADKLVAGKNTIYTKVVIDDDSSSRTVRTIDIYDISIAPSSLWRPLKKFGIGTGLDQLNFGFTFPGYPTENNIPVTVKYYIDNIEVHSQSLTQNSGSYNLNSLDAVQTLVHGDHTLTVTAYAKINGLDIEIGTLTYNFMWVELGNTTPIIISNYNNTEEKNYSIINIPFMVYDPTSLTNAAEVSFYINGTEVSTGSQQITYNSENWATWEINEYIAKEVNTFMLSCRDINRVFTVNIVQDDSRNLDPISQDAYLHLTAFGRSNTESVNVRNTWINKVTGEDYHVTFNKFNWYNNGWIRDEDNNVALRLSNGANISIPLQVLDSEAGQSLTFEIEFKIRNTTEYAKLVYITMEPDGFEEDGITPKYKPVKHIATDANIVGQYLKNNIGLCIGTQEAYFKGQNKIVNVSYPDEERVKVSVVLSKTDNLLYIYINGVLTGIESFSTAERFNAEATELTFNSDYCDIDIFNIRVYKAALDYIDIVQNWVGDAPNLNDRLERYDQNAISSVDNVTKRTYIDYEKTMKSGLIPVMTIKTYDAQTTGQTGTDMLPYAKGNKIGVGVRYWDPEHPEKSFHCQNVELDVQGTSSQGYPRRNYKLKTKKAYYKALDNKYVKDEEGKDTDQIEIDGSLPFQFQQWDGKEVTKFVYTKGKDSGKWDLGHGIKETTFCLKADYMESSSTHNTGMANLVNRLSDKVGAFDFRHPLVRNGKMDSCRTTIYGYPILLFHENAAGDISFIGKYNFNIDKGATDSFGFTQTFEHPFVDQVPKLSSDENGIYSETEFEKATYENVAECWELKNNQSGGRATFQLVDWDATDTNGKLAWLNDFEARYHYADWDAKDIYEAYGTNIAGANRHINSYTKNFARLCDWIHSTDTSNPHRVVGELNPAVYYTTLDTTYDSSRFYYANPGDETPVTVLFSYTAKAKEGQYITLNKDTFLQQAILNNTTEVEEAIVGSYSFLYDEDEGWILNTIPVRLSDWGITLLTPPNGDPITTVDISISETNDWSAEYYEKFTTDSDRYRLAKFKNEFSKHMDLSYTAFYAVMTEFLIMYDSRAKNMMLASWGPEEVGGEYIWYPIFYDMDTQLGVNNSGVVYWDYGTNPTPDDPNEVSIYSGAASVLWNNFTTCFIDVMKLVYRGLRDTGGLNYNELIHYYDTLQCDKWSEIMKNLDQFYKYIAPSLPSYGYIDQEGEQKTTNTFFYCLQGDRKLNRDLFFRNRLNYMDSKWQGGTYTAGQQRGSNIQMRYNINDGSNTSDSGMNTPDNLNANATFNIEPYLSQYCMVFYDEAVTTPVRFDVENKDEVPYITIEPIESIKNKINSNSPFTQQLAYVYGPEYISDLGDLSLKYLNEFFGAGAKRLRKLIVGNENPKYINKCLTDKNFSLNSSATIKDGGVDVINTQAKTLLQILDISNIPTLSADLDISGCTKLEILKALGTNLTNISIPSGNIIKRAYFPSTITSIELIEPQALTSLITDVNDVVWPGEGVEDTRPDGLYIEGLTTVLDEPTSADALTKINRYSIENTLLKYDTYRILKKLYDIKCVMQNSATLSNVYSPSLSLSLEKVDWTPYHKLPEDALYDSSVTYYVRNDDMTYEPYYYNAASWRNELINVGIYTKESEDSIIPNLDIIKTFIDRYKAPLTEIPVSKQYFKSIYEDSTGQTKRLPPITGHLHVQNTSETALDEFELYDFYNKYYPDLTITANYVTPCVRAKFVEYLDGKLTVHGVQKAKANSSTVTSYSGAIPKRLHYDFLGWAPITQELIDNNSIGTIDDVVDLSTILLDTNTTYIAVFAIHSYTVHFLNWDGSFVADVLIPSGSTIVEPNLIPYRDDSELALDRCYHFLGYGYNDGTNKTVNLHNITVYKEGLSYYAKYEEKSVYDSILPDNAIVVTLNAKGDGAKVGLNPDILVRGKICFPKIATYTVGSSTRTLPVTDIDGPSPTEVSKGFGNVNNDNNYANYRIGSNGLAGNPYITHIFFEGNNDNTSSLSNIEGYSFMGMENLQHVDFPNSLLTLNVQSLCNCPKLSFDSTNNIRYFGTSCFSGSNLYGDYTDLQIKGSIQRIEQNAFGAAGWTSITLGSENDPCPLEISNLGGGKVIFGGNILGLKNRILNTFTMYSTHYSSPTDIESMLDPYQSVEINVSVSLVG